MSFKIESPKDVAIVILVALVCIMGTGWYYNADNAKMTEQITLTEDFLKGVNWNQNAVAFLNSIGYSEVTFTPQQPTQQSNGGAPADSTGDN